MHSIFFSSLMSIVWSSDSFHLARLLCIWLVLSHFACLYMHKIEVQALESMQRDEKTKQEKKMQTLKSVSCRQPTYVLSTTYFSHPLQFTWCFRWIFRGKLYIWDVCGVVFFPLRRFLLFHLQNEIRKCTFVEPNLDAVVHKMVLNFIFHIQRSYCGYGFFSSSIQEIIRLVESCE